MLGEQALEQSGVLGIAMKKVNLWSYCELFVVVSTNGVAIARAIVRRFALGAIADELMLIGQNTARK